MRDFKIKLRSADLSDAAPLAELSCQLGYATDEADSEHRLSLIVQQDGNAVFVAESSRGGVIGWVHVFSTLRVESAPFAELGGLVVAEGSRGMGVGRLLVEAAEQWSRESGLCELRVRSNVTREDAHRFYANLGFGHSKSQAVLIKKLDA
jgi:GNAT superfamily N-acetyltransferase